MLRQSLALLCLLVVSQTAQVPRPKQDETPPADQKVPNRFNYPHVDPPSDRPDGHADDCQSYPCLIFEDNFDFLDFDTWQHEFTAGGGGNWEFQYYTNNRTNSYTRDGHLFIKPTLTEDRFGPGSVTSGTLDLWGMAPANECTGNAFYGCFRVGSGSNPINPVQSARLRTAKTFAFKYGKMEVNARMPRGDWLWPAIWMLPRDEEYGGWPASGEIDLVESRGNADLRTATGTSVGQDHMGATLHWGPYFPQNGYEKTTSSVNTPPGSPTYGEALHRYGVEWEPEAIRFYLDDEQILEVNADDGGFWNMGGWDGVLPDESNPWRHDGTKFAPFDKPFYMVMNVAVGGTNGFFGDDWTNAGYPKPWNNQSPTAFLDFWNALNQWYPTWNPDVNNGEDAAMEVDYIRVWKMKEETNSK